MAGDLPDYYFRIRENGAAVFRLDAANRQRRIEMEQIAVVNIRNGEVKPHGQHRLTDADKSEIARWTKARRETLGSRQTTALPHGAGIVQRDQVKRRHVSGAVFALQMGPLQGGGPFAQQGATPIDSPWRVGRCLHRVLRQLRPCVWVNGEPPPQSGHRGGAACGVAQAFFATGPPVVRTASQPSACAGSAPQSPAALVNE